MGYNETTLTSFDGRDPSAISPAQSSSRQGGSVPFRRRSLTHSEPGRADFLGHPLRRACSAFLDFELLCRPLERLIPCVGEFPSRTAHRTCKVRSSRVRGA